MKSPKAALPQPELTAPTLLAKLDASSANSLNDSGTLTLAKE